MRSSIGRAGTIMVALALLSSCARAQPASPFDEGGGDAAVFDPAQLPSTRGTLRQYTLTPRGDIDGLILADGTEVKVPPHLSTQIAFVLKPGDKVTVHGLHAAAIPLVQAMSVTNDATRQTVVDKGPPGKPPKPHHKPPPPPRAGALGEQTQVQGRIRMPLHGAHGEINGGLLEDGTVLRLPPPEADRMKGLLQPGRMVVARGQSLTTALGTVVDVATIGAGPDATDKVRPGSPPPPG